MSYAAFVSFSYNNRVRAEKIQKLLSDAGFPTWFSVRDTTPGEDLTDVIRTAIGQSHAMVVLWTPASQTSPWVLKEIECAKEYNIPRVYIVTDDVEKDSATLPEDHDIYFLNYTQKDLSERLTDAVRKYYTGKTPVVCMLNMKGGVGKTVLSANVFGCVAQTYGKRVLLVDMDPQHNLTQYLLPEYIMEQCWLSDRNVVSAFEPSKLNGFKTPTTDLKVISHGQIASAIEASFPLIQENGAAMLRLVPGTFDVCKYTLPINDSDAEFLEHNFRTFIEQARSEFDVVVLDVNPGSSLLTKFALKTGGMVVSPVRPDRFAERGLKLLDDLLVKAFEITPLPLRLCLMNGVNANSISTVEEKIKSKRDLLEGRIPYSTLLEARPVVIADDGNFTRELAYNSNMYFANPIKESIRKVAEELMRRLGVRYESKFREGVE